MTTTFIINGTPYTVDLTNFPPDITLNTFIREHAQLTATKYMCLEGGCGACVCVVKGKHSGDGVTSTWAVNSCLTLLNTCADWEITTAEGLGNKRNGYHPIQKRLAKMNGTQCGFCSPGIVMNMYGLLESKDGKVTMEEVENSFGGNICRCTGYRPILDAMKSFAVDSTIQVPESCRDIEDSFDSVICKKTGLQCNMSCKKPTISNLIYDDGTQWHWPHTLSELCKILADINNDEFMLVAGNTAHGVYRRPLNIKHFIDIHALPELRQHSIGNDKLVLGANLSLTEAMNIFVDVSRKSGFEYCQQLWQHFDLIANVPVRNSGTLAGNISMKRKYSEFPSDIFVTFEALDVKLIVAENENNQKTMSLKEYLGHNNNNLIIIAFELKAYPKERFIFHSYKIMPRSQNAHAYVNAAFLLDMELKEGKVNGARICFGGINPDFSHATALETALVGQVLYDKDTILNIFKDLAIQLEPDSKLPDASPNYRRILACGLLYKTLLKLAPANKIKDKYKSGGDLLERPLSSGLQSFETNEKYYPVTQAVEKVEAMIQCSGEATYMNDIITTSNAVYCAFANATKVGATIEKIDASEILKTPGVIAFYTAKDIPGTNLSCDPSFGFKSKEEIFCSGVVEYYSQPLGVVVALTSDMANRAASLVKVTYSSMNARKILPTTSHVFKQQATDRLHRIKSIGLENDIELSDVPDIKGKGIFEMGGQYHFSMEPQTTIAVPFEDGLQIWSATQWMDHTQSAISKMLQIKAKDVQLKVRRLGGAYGCKISRGNQVACAASLVAYKLNCPARFVQTIESMMNSNGKRWGCRSDYEFQIKSNGKIVGLKNVFYEDAGCTLNENPVHNSIGCAKNCYELTESNTKITGEAVLTDAPSSTWCRAPGSVEGIAMIENILEHIAFEANIDPADARLANLKSGNKMEELLPRFLKKTEYRERRKEIDTFNENNRWIKRGLGLAIMEYPVFLFGHYPATVSVYHVDGTVVISHGGIEMGQGMNTKIAQVAAYTLGIPLSYIKIESSDTINGANSMVTGGAVGSESLCFAVRKACETLNERLQVVKEELGKDADWLNVVQQAWAKAINMIVSDYYKKGDMENYKVYGLALTEIEVDILTGSNQIKRVDILEDAGESLSPHIDIGQVEGSFVMLLGYWLTEQLVYDRQSGELLTNRTWNYKPPGAKDIPIDFRIELLQNNPNPAGFMRSKATGEPPCCLAVSAIFAIQHALQSARKDAGLKREWVRLGAPTTPETIVLNAGTNTSMFSLV